MAKTVNSALLIQVNHIDDLEIAWAAEPGTTKTAVNSAAD
jgi:hypothetical protein